jgi:5-methylcytosine-specific restriction endonuclease McrA
MKFTAATKRKARLRQFSRCGVCGDNLDWTEEHAHHIHPDALGGPDKVDNCVILCHMCHDRVHNDGNTRSGIVAPLDYFEYING